MMRSGAPGLAMVCAGACACALGLACFAVAGCESGPAAIDDAAPAPPDLATTPNPPDLVLPPPAYCTAIACLPPACCGKQCAMEGDCCPGATCLDGQCKPVLCRTCGERGCAVDYQKCTAACVVPPCCLAVCANDGECCPSTKCQKDTQGVKRCVPKECDTCSGFRPVCDVTNVCSINCVPPASCGMACLLDADCGGASVCRRFLDGKSRCVPPVFENACNACGPGGCLFRPDLCSVECPPPADLGVARDLALLDLAALPDGGAVDAAMPPDAVMVDLTVRDLASLDTAGIDGDVLDDLAVPGDLALPEDLAIPDLVMPADLAAPMPADIGNFAPGCKSCCQPCASDGECCADQRCRSDGKGHMICTPAACLQCPFGCTFTCP